MPESFKFDQITVLFRGVHPDMLRFGKSFKELQKLITQKGRRPKIYVLDKRDCVIPKSDHLGSKNYGIRSSHKIETSVNVSGRDKKRPSDTVDIQIYRDYLSYRFTTSVTESCYVGVFQPHQLFGDFDRKTAHVFVKALKTVKKVQQNMDVKHKKIQVELVRDESKTMAKIGMCANYMGYSLQNRRAVESNMKFQTQMPQIVDDLAGNQEYWICHTSMKLNFALTYFQGFYHAVKTRSMHLESYRVWPLTLLELLLTVPLHHGRHIINVYIPTKHKYEDIMNWYKVAHLNLQDQRPSHKRDYTITQLTRENSEQDPPISKIMTLLAYLSYYRNETMLLRTYSDKYGAKLARTDFLNGDKNVVRTLPTVRDKGFVDAVYDVMNFNQVETDHNGLFMYKWPKAARSDLDKIQNYVAQKTPDLDSHPAQPTDSTSDPNVYTRPQSDSSGATGYIDFVRLLVACETHIDTNLREKENSHKSEFLTDSLRNYRYADWPRTRTKYQTDEILDCERLDKESKTPIPHTFESANDWLLMKKREDLELRVK